MSDLKSDDEESLENDETEKVVKKTEKNTSTKLFAQKLKEKKGIMDEARKQLPFTFLGNYFRFELYYNSLLVINDFIYNQKSKCLKV